MTNQHPITPPHELVTNWILESDIQHEDMYEGIATRAAQWGADQELEACCEWTQGYAECGDSLRAARRPKPPSLKEQALEMLENAWEGGHINNNAAQTIRRALEALPE
jgi:hypothetical protein